jgi:polyhydroxybutyrate depolymerase
VIVMLFTAHALLILMFAGFAGSGGSKRGDFGAETVKVGDATREYRLVVPKTVDLAKPAPLVVAFHGMLIDSKDVMPQYAKLNETAEKHGFIIAYPNAIRKSWGIAPEKVKNDPAFFDALLRKLAATYKIDQDRVYAVGMSNGGYFAHLVGRERSKIVAAVASHSGPLGLQTLLGVNAERKFPALIIHGHLDRIFPVVIARENRDKYRREGHEVKYVELKNVGHMWGTKADINETIWKFFEDHPLEKKYEPSGRDQH